MMVLVRSEAARGVAARRAGRLFAGDPPAAAADLCRPMLTVVSIRRREWRAGSGAGCGLGEWAGWSR